MEKENGPRKCAWPQCENTVAQGETYCPQCRAQNRHLDGARKRLRAARAISGVFSWLAGKERKVLNWSESRVRQEHKIEK